MKRLAIIAALISHAAFAATLTDNFGRTVTVSGNTYSVSGVTVTAPNDTAALTVLNGMAPDGWAPPAAPSTTISALAFVNRFTSAEQQANLLWAMQLSAAAASTGGQIDVTNAELLAGMSQRVAAGTLTQARMTQILNLSVASP